MSTVPETSKEAKQLKTDESKRRDYDRIVAAYKIIGEGHYEDVAIVLGVTDLNIVSRRMKEMRDMGLLENTGIKKKTSRNRNAFVHKLYKGEKPPPAEKTTRTFKELKIAENVIVVSEYIRRKKIIEVPTKIHQEKLF